MVQERKLHITKHNGDKNMAEIHSGFVANSDIDMNGKKITGLPAPSGDDEAATKEYVDSIDVGTRGTSTISSETSSKDVIDVAATAGKYVFVTFLEDYTPATRFWVSDVGDVGGGPYSVDEDTIALYHCDDGSGTTVTDETGNYDASLSNADAWSATAKYGAASIYPNALYRMTQSTLLDSMPDNGTVEFWFCPDIDVSKFYVLFRKYGGDGKDLGLWFEAAASYALQFYKVGSDGVKTINSTTNTWTAGTWYHVAITWGSEGMKLWINDECEATGESTTAPGGGTATDFTVGSNYGHGDEFDGKIDEIRVSSVQRTPPFVGPGHAGFTIHVSAAVTNDSDFQYLIL